MYSIMSIVLLYTVCVQATHTNEKHRSLQELMQEESRIEHSIATLESVSSPCMTREALMLEIDVLRAQLAAIRALIINFSGSGLDVIESELEVIESDIDQLGLCAPTPILEPGTVPAPVTLIQTAGVTIDDPGHYCLAHDLDASAVAIAIEITSSNVTLDLNSKTISGAGAQGVVLDTGIADTIIKNGAFSGLDIGISGDNNNATQIINCSFSTVADASVMLTGATNTTIKDCSSSASPIGFDLSTCQNSMITNCSVAGATGAASVYGFRIIDGAANCVQHCSVEGIATTGTDSDIEVAGFVLDGTQTRSKIIDCVVDSVTAPTDPTFADPSFAAAYGIKVQTLTGEFDVIENATIGTELGGGNAIAAEWSPNSNYLAITAVRASLDAVVMVFKMSDVDAFILLPSSEIVVGNAISVPTLAWSPNGDFLAVGSSLANNQLKIYSFSGEALIEIQSEDAGATVLSIAWSPDNRYLAVGAEQGGTVDELQVWSFTTALALVEQVSDASDVSAVAWSPNGHFVAAGDSGSDFMLYDFDGTTLTVLDTLALANPIIQLSWSAHGDFLALATDGTSPLLYPVTDSGTFGTVINGTATGSNAVKWSPDGKFVVYDDENADVITAQLVFSAGVFSLVAIDSATHGAAITAVPWSADGQMFAIAGTAVGGVGVRAYRTQFTGATECAIKDCTVSCVAGGQGTGVGISASSDDTTARANVAFNNDIQYVGLTNVYVGGYFGVPTLIQNIAIPPL